MRRRLFMRLDAVCDAVLALFLLSSSWDALFRWLGLPAPKPSLYAQLLGAALVALAIVEWTIADRPGRRAVARGVAAGSALAAVVIAVWLVAGDLEADTHGKLILVFVAGFLVLESALHARTGWHEGE
jgi:CDP-diglyceride synthetase